MNKIGSYNLSVLAKENGVALYAVVPTSTIDLSLETGDEIPIEERSGIEVTGLAYTHGERNENTHQKRSKIWLFVVFICF